MKFINTTKNTIRLPDIDRDIQYLEGDKEQFISLNDVKKSKCFRHMVVIGDFHITSHDNSLFERSLVKQEGVLKEAKEKAKAKISTQESEVISPTTDLEVKIKGHFFEAGGYAKVNRNMAKGLKNLGVKVEIDPVSVAINDLAAEELKTLKSMKKKVSREAIAIDSVIPTFSMPTHGKYKILYTTVESPTIPQQFVDSCNQYNEIWVTSDFCKEVLENHKVNPDIYVFPDTVDKNIYNEESDPYEFNPSLNKFVFVSVFGWGYRKGYDALLKSYLQEFTGDDDVSLLIVSRYQSKTSRSDKIKDEIEDYIKKYGGDNPPHIARYSKVIPEVMMPSIYRACDAFALFSRGEGFGLPYAEASMCGLPIIATNHSGHTMFLKRDNSFLVDIDSIQKISQGTMNIHYWDGQEFPVLKSEGFIYDCQEVLRHVYENKESATDKNNALKEYLTDNYNINKVCSDMRDRLYEIRSNLK